MEYSWITYVIGFTAQIFSARTLFQWVKAEKSKSVVSPLSYWVFSLAGSYLFCLYGWLRDDFSIILGQFISYYIYLWNLDNKKILKRLHPVIRIILVGTPVVAAAFMLKDIPAFVDNFFFNEKVSFGLVLFGSAGQIIFTLRFIYQWFYSVRRHQSFLPRGFWIIRHDPVLILGQSFGFVAYTRNLMIGRKERKTRKQAVR